MGRTFSIPTAVHHCAIRRLYKALYYELGEAAPFVSKTYFVMCIAKKRKCSESSVSQVLCTKANRLKYKISDIENEYFKGEFLPEYRFVSRIMNQKPE